MNKIFLLFITKFMLLFFSFSSFAQEGETLTVVKKSSNNTTTISKKRGGIGLFARFAIGIGYNYNLERTCTYYDIYCNEDFTGYYLTTDINGLQTDKDKTLSSFENSWEIPLDLDVGFHVGKKFILFASVAANNLILKNHRIEVDNRIGLSDIQNCGSYCTIIGVNITEKSTIWDIGGGIGFYTPLRSIKMDYFFSGEVYYSILSSKFDINSLYDGEKTSGKGWGFGLQTGIELPIFNKLLIVGIGVYAKYHRITFENTNGKNSGFLYGRVLKINDVETRFINGQKTNFDVYSFGIYISASVFLFG